MVEQADLFSVAEYSSVARLNPFDAPDGFLAVLKSDVVTQSLGNICRACDWRPECDGRAHRCMSYTVITDDGKELKRDDGQSVVFKRKTPSGTAAESKT
jgi:hypothetical protein